MAIVKVRGTLNNGLFSPLKRPRVDIIRGESTASHQLTISEVEDEDRRKVKKAMNAYQEILTKFFFNKLNKRNWSTYMSLAIHLRNQGEWINTRKQLGAIRGVKVGDKFRYRAQLNIVGLHRQFTFGIDYMRSKYGQILATSIVDSGRYANNMQSPDILIYSGQGGNSPFNKKKPTDQVLERGNLALKNSNAAQTPVRELAEPSIQDAFNSCVEQGANCIIVSPFFLLPGRHWNQEIPSLTSEAAKEHPGVSYMVAATLGLHPLLVDVMNDRITHCLSHIAGDAGECALCVGTGKCQLH